MVQEFSWPFFQITRMCFFDCGITLGLGRSEQERNGLLMELCVVLQQKTGWQWEIANVSTLSGGENVSEELRRYGMPLHASIPKDMFSVEAWFFENAAVETPEEDLHLYLYENGIGLLSVTSYFKARGRVTIEIVDSFLNLFMNWLSPAYYPQLLWKGIQSFREIVAMPKWQKYEVRELRRLDQFTTASQEAPAYLVYLTCILNNLWGKEKEESVHSFLSAWISDSFAGDQPVTFRPHADGLFSAISWDLTLIVTRGERATQLGKDVIRLLELIHYFWFLIYMTDSLLNRRIREIEIAHSAPQVEGGIKQLRAFRIHIWRTIDNFRLVKLSMLPLHMSIFEIARKEWKIDQIESSIADKLNFLDRVYEQLRDELQDHRQSNLNLIALLFTIVTFASAVASIISTYDYDNTQFTRFLRAWILISSPFFAAVVTWLVFSVIGRRRRKN